MSVVVYSSFQPHSSRTHYLKVRPLVAIWALVVIILCASLCIGTARVASLNQDQAAADSVQTTTKPSVSAQLIPVATTTPTVQPPAAAPVQASAAVANCSPYAGTTAPSSLSLSSAPDGLAKQIDSPTTYQIYGNTAATLRAQVRQCAPKSDDASGAIFTAQTIYKLTWQYSYVSIGDGSCKISHAKVGLHVMQIMPFWQPTTAALGSQWQSFMGALATHENGHTALDTQYAQTLLDDLNGFPATPCGQLAQSVKHITDSDVATLNQANDNYDSSTNHGATQGAILPQ